MSRTIKKDLDFTSHVPRLCQEKGIENPNQLLTLSGLPSATCKSLMEGVVRSKPLETLVILAMSLGVEVHDLYDVNSESGVAEQA